MADGEKQKKKNGGLVRSGIPRLENSKHTKKEREIIRGDVEIQR